MGTDKLKRMAEEAPGELAGDVAALAAELRAGEWSSVDDLLRSFPSARAAGRNVTIAVRDSHRVSMLINYQAGFILIEEAQRRDAGTRQDERKLR